MAPITLSRTEGEEKEVDKKEEETMFQTGLLIVTNPLRQIRSTFRAYLRAIKPLIKSRLYIQLETDQQVLWPIEKRQLSSGDLHQMRQIIPSIYFEAANVCPLLDIRVFQGIVKQKDDLRYTPSATFDVVYTDGAHPKDHVINYVDYYFKQNCGNVLSISKEIAVQDDSSGNNNGDTLNESKISVEGTECNYPFETFESVCLGGTFDRLHTGHKLLLSEALIHAQGRLIVGVTDDNMIKNKLLWELIEPIERRIEAVSHFLSDVDPTVEPQVVPISDPFGPTVTDPTLKCLYVSEETLKGGNMVNEERHKRGYPPMKILVVHLVPNRYKEQKEEEDKLSSSAGRMRLLGTLLRKPTYHPNMPKRPHIIGVTGGICTGKTHISETLRSLGAVVLNADRIGHESYAPGTRINQMIVDAFGNDVRAEDGTIDRKKLGAIVFSDPLQRERLNGLVWPEIARILGERIEKERALGTKVVVIEAALLIEAGWDSMVHQIWCSVISEKEAIRRIMERDGASEELALKKVRSQIPAKQFIERANVVLSSMWETEVTQRQVKRAWTQLHQFFSENPEFAP